MAELTIQKRYPKTKCANMISIVIPAHNEGLVIGPNAEGADDWCFARRVRCGRRL